MTTVTSDNMDMSDVSDNSDNSDNSENSDNSDSSDYSDNSNKYDKRELFNALLIQRSALCHFSIVALLYPRREQEWATWRLLSLIPRSTGKGSIWG